MEITDLLLNNPPINAAIIAFLASLIGAFAYLIRQRTDEKRKRAIELLERDKDRIERYETLREIAEMSTSIVSMQVEIEHEKRKREYLADDPRALIDEGDKPKNEWSLDGEIVYIAKAQ